MVGTSGFSYADWKGVLYPPKLASRAWLGYYATRVDAVEMDADLQPFRHTCHAVARFGAVPAHFAFALKASQTITHRKPFPACKKSSTRWCRISRRWVRASCSFSGSPSLTLDEHRLEGFLTAASARLAGAKIRPRLAMEIRHPSWNVQDVFARLAGHGWAVATTTWSNPAAGGFMTAGGTGRCGSVRSSLLIVSSHCFTCGFMGRRDFMRESMVRPGLEPWAALAETAIEHGRPVHAYFNNTMAGAAVQDATPVHLHDSRASFG